MSSSFNHAFIQAMPWLPAIYNPSIIADPITLYEIIQAHLVACLIWRGDNRDL